MPGPVVITGGGTGGHVFPMQAIAERLRSRGVPAAAIRFVGSRRGQERRLLAATGIELTLLPGRGLRRSSAPMAVVANVGAVTGLGAAFVIAFWKVGRWRPSVVVSVGGYASFAVALSAVLWRRPLVLVELDATPGAAHRVLDRYARRRCTAFASSDPRSVVTGAPLREGIERLDRSPTAIVAARANAEPPIEPGRRVVVVMTGSLGATSVNLAVSGLAQLWSQRRDRTIIHVTGRRDFEQVVARRPATEGLDYRIVEFGAMEDLWSLCDVALCRAGATTVAELTLLGIPSILVPLPNAPGDHQTKNAEMVVAAHGAVLVPDAQCSPTLLSTTLDAMLVDAELDSMSRAASALGRRGSAAAIAAVVADVGGWS